MPVFFVRVSANLESLLHGVEDSAGEFVVGVVAAHIGSADLAVEEVSTT